MQLAAGPPRIIGPKTCLCPNREPTKQLGWIQSLAWKQSCFSSAKRICLGSMGALTNCSGNQRHWQPSHQSLHQRLPLAKIVSFDVNSRCWVSSLGESNSHKNEKLGPRELRFPIVELLMVSRGCQRLGFSSCSRRTGSSWICSLAW